MSLSVVISFSLKGVVQLSLTHLVCLSQLTKVLQVSGSNSHWFYKHRTEPLHFLKPNIMGISFSFCEVPGVRAHFCAVSTCSAPSLLKAASLHLSDLHHFSDVAYSLYLVMELFFFPLPVFRSLSVLLNWTWMISSCKYGTG